MIIGTPVEITSEIRSFCKQIVANTNPFYLAVEPAHESVKLDCFTNVEKFIIENGGSIYYGWRIGEWSEIMLEAEFHAVWRSPNGDFRDVTPTYENQILFLPDSTRFYKGKQISNIRFALSNSPLVCEFIEVQRKIFEEMNKGSLAEKHGRVYLPTVTPLRKRSELLFVKIIKFTMKPNSLCFCGSGMKYKKCCKNRI